MRLSVTRGTTTDENNIGTKARHTVAVCMRLLPCLDCTAAVFRRRDTYTLTDHVQICCKVMSPRSEGDEEGLLARLSSSENPSD